MFKVFVLDVVFGPEAVSELEVVAELVGALPPPLW
jgi:hypothetical protein